MTKQKQPIKITERRRITGQVIYMGPHVRHIGLSYGAIFRDGIFDQLYEVIDRCPALGELFVPIGECGRVRRELNFDIARNMRGTRGKHVTFYREVQNWLATQATESKQQQTGVKLQTHV
jgi:hypothetical protein